MRMIASPCSLPEIVSDRRVSVCDGPTRYNPNFREEEPLLMASKFSSGRAAVEQVTRSTRPTSRSSCAPHHRVITAAPRGHRLGLVLKGHPEQRFIGLGARHGLHVDQAGRNLQLGADRAYTGPDCPPDMLDVGGIPQGDYAPVPFLLSSRGWAAWIENDGHGVRFDLGDEVMLSTRAAAGPLKVHLFTHPTPAAQLRAFLRADGRAARAARVGLRVLEEPGHLPPPARGRGRARRLPRARHRARRDRARLALGDAIQHVGVQPASVPGRARVHHAGCARTACGPWCGSRRG